MQQIITNLRADIAAQVGSASARELLAMASRLVDEPAAMPVARPRSGFVLVPQWEIVSDDIVRETQTGLEYFRDDVPGGKRNWDDSMAAARNLDVGGFKDWRPPNLIEQLFMMDRKRSNPAYDTAIFRGNKDHWVWVNEEYAPVSGCAWGVSFNGGLSLGNYRNCNGFVRAVRGGQF